MPRCPVAVGGRPHALAHQVLTAEHPHSGAGILVTPSPVERIRECRTGIDSLLSRPVASAEAEPRGHRIAPSGFHGELAAASVFVPPSPSDFPEQRRPALEALM